MNCEKIKPNHEKGINIELLLGLNGTKWIFVIIFYYFGINCFLSTDRFNIISWYDVIKDCEIKVVF